MEDKHVDINLFIDRIIEKDSPLKYAELLVSVSDHPVFPFGIIQGETKIKSIQKSKYFSYDNSFNSNQEIPLNFEIHNSSFLFGGSVDIRDCYTRAIHSDTIENFEGKTQLLSNTGRPGPYIFFKGSITISNSPWKFNTDSPRSTTPHHQSPVPTNRYTSYSNTKPFVQPMKYNSRSARGLSRYYARPSSTLNATTAVPTPAIGTSFANNMTNKIVDLTATAQHILNKQNQISKPNERLFPDPNYNLGSTTYDSNYTTTQTKKNNSTGYKRIKVKDNIPRCALPENNYKIPPKIEEPPPPKRKVKAKAKTQGYKPSSVGHSNTSQAQTIAPPRSDKPHVEIDLSNTNPNPANTTPPPVSTSTSKTESQREAVTMPIVTPTEPEITESKTEEPKEEHKTSKEEPKEEVKPKEEKKEEHDTSKEEKKEEHDTSKEEKKEDIKPKDEKKEEVKSKDDKKKKDDDDSSISISSVNDSDLEDKPKTTTEEKKEDKSKPDISISSMIDDVVSTVTGTESKKEEKKPANNLNISGISLTDSMKKLLGDDDKGKEEKPASKKEEKKPTNDLNISGISLSDSMKKIIGDDDKGKEKKKEEKTEHKKEEKKPANDLNISGVSLTDSMKKILGDDDKGKEEKKETKKGGEKKKDDDHLSDVSGLSDILDDDKPKDDKPAKKPEGKSETKKEDEKGSIDSDDYF